MGLPGSGKTTLAKELVKVLPSVHFNADRVRQTMNVDLSFSMDDRLEHARRMGWMCQYVSDSGYTAIADFVCPTEETRAAFNPDFIIWMNTTSSSRYADTNAIFVPPRNPDLVIKDFLYDVKQIKSSLLKCSKSVQLNSILINLESLISKEFN